MMQCWLSDEVDDGEYSVRDLVRSCTSLLTKLAVLLPCTGRPASIKVERGVILHLTCRLARALP